MVSRMTPNSRLPPSIWCKKTNSLCVPGGQFVSSGRSGRAPSRVGKRAVTFYMSPEAFRQLAVLAATTDRSVQDLMAEATDLLFQQHGLARIARE